MSSIRSAGCLIIGDEVLNGKILDTNLFEFAKYCFLELSVPLRRTIVCADNEQDIIKSLRSLRDDNCDFIVTSGGIGLTHDDITYSSLAHAFGLQCKLDQETVAKMHQLRGNYLSLLSPSQKDAFYRMATIPQSSADVEVLKLYTHESLWVPIVGINNQVYILPGVPTLFKRLLHGLGEALKERVVPKHYRRYYVSTRTNESNLAPFLTQLQDKCDATHNYTIKLGSYPHFNWKINTISIIGDETVAVEDLRQIVSEVIAGVKGGAKEITAEEEDHMCTHEPSSP